MTSTGVLFYKQDKVLSSLVIIVILYLQRIELNNTLEIVQQHK